MKKWSRLIPLALFGAVPVAAQVPHFQVDTVRVEVGSRASADLPVHTRGVEVISAATLERLPVRTLGEALDWALGMDVMPRSPAQVDLAARGSTFEQVLVLVDGVRVSDPQTGHFALNTAVPLAQVERVEVLRGTASALYGSEAVGGVINIVTRRGAAPGGSVRAEQGSFGTRVLAGAARTGGSRLRLDVAADRQRSDGHRPGTDYTITQGRVATEARLAGRTLRAEVARAERDFGADGFYAPRPSYEETRATTARLAWLAAPGARRSVDVRTSYRVHDDDFILIRDDPAVYRNLHTTTQLGGEVVGRLDRGAALRLAGGVEAYREALESTNLGDHREHRAALFGEAVTQMGRDVILAFGARSDWHSEYGAFLAPSVAAAWWIHPDLRLRGSLGRAFRAPTWTERFYQDPTNIGTPDLRPERAWSGEAAADYSPLPGTRFAVTGWVRLADGLIDWARTEVATEPWRTRNVGNAFFRGIEGEVETDMLGTRLAAQAAALRFTARDAAGFTSKYALRPLTRTLSVSATRRLLPGVEATARTRYSRRAGTTPATGASGCLVGAPESHLTVDGRLAFRLRQGRIYADGSNLADRDWCDISARPGAGRALSLGVEWGW